MHIHLIGGFLGSGKTTAINHAIQILTQAGKKVAVITNDQGSELVDSRFTKLSAVATTQVTGGCFCCNYHDLDTQINQLQNEVKPAIIFAETVGSCTDLVATVLKPLLQFRNQHNGTVNYSGFVDAHLLLMHVQGTTLPFLPETNYIWEKQLEEAEILVVNKTDILTAVELSILQKRAKEKWPSKQLLFQNSFDAFSIKKWLQLTSDTSTKNPRSIEIDYPTYAVGEANLAWLDVELEFFTGNNTASEKADRFIRRFAAGIRQQNFPIGHLKFFVVADGQAQKISFTTTNSPDDFFAIQKANTVQILVNARVQTEPDALHKQMKNILKEITSEGAVIINQKNLSFFKPGFPKPAYRLV